MAVDQFLKIDDIKGESADSKHKEEIDVLAWSWGASNSGTMHSGGGGGSGKANVQDLSITKHVDKSSTNLLQAACDGTHFKVATLVVRKAGKTPLEYLTIKMEEVIITSLSTGGSGGEDRLTENVSLNFSKFTVSYKGQKSDGTAEPEVKANWDMKANKTA